MPRRVERDVSLPSERAFVVQLYATSDVVHGPVAGRAEHVVSARATHFGSMDDLLRFIASVLQAREEGGGQEATPEAGASGQGGEASGERTPGGEL